MIETKYKGYLITEDGKLFSSKRNIFLKGNITQYGYKRYLVYHNNKRKMTFAHSLVAEAFIGEKPKDFEVNHKDGNKLNNHFNNLEYVTRSRNVKHAYDNDLCKQNKKVTIINIFNGLLLTFNTQSDCLRALDYKPTSSILSNIKNINSRNIFLKRKYRVLEVD